MQGEKDINGPNIAYSYSGKKSRLKTGFCVTPQVIGKLVFSIFVDVFFL